MEASEIKKHMDEFEKTINIEEYFLKYPVDMLVTFNDDNIKTKLQENVDQVFKFKKLLFISEAKYNELEDLYDEVISDQFDWYKFEYDKSLNTLEIKEFYIRKDPKVKQIKRFLNKQKIRMNFFKLCLDCFLNQGERMRDYLKK